MISVDIFYLALVLVGLIGFATSLAYFASQDLKCARRARPREAAFDARRPAKPQAQPESFAKAA
ncbi:hypothetical protein [Methyloceanibacter sp.]|uniref:hypothetical protein n=1 Tax=Methyloceanibacter sp. TaxID=1965321 RepID=UPI00351B3133